MHVSDEQTRALLGLSASGVNTDHTSVTGQLAVLQPPQWLLPAFGRVCRALGATASDDTVNQIGIDLLKSWSRPGQHLHNLRHLVTVLESLDVLNETMHHPDCARIATWFHGLDFDYNRGEEQAGFQKETRELADLQGTLAETESRISASIVGVGSETQIGAFRAQYALMAGSRGRPHPGKIAQNEARLRLAALGIGAKQIEYICKLIAVIHCCPLVTLEGLLTLPEFADVPDAGAVCDAHLSVLAKDPQRYRSYLAALELENVDKVPVNFFRARLDLVSYLLDKRQIFTSPLGSEWEEPARENLLAEQDRLREMITHLEAHIPTMEQDNESNTDESITSQSTASLPAVESTQAQILTSESSSVLPRTEVSAPRAEPKSSLRRISIAERMALAEELNMEAEDVDELLSSQASLLISKTEQADELDDLETSTLEECNFEPVPPPHQPTAAEEREAKRLEFTKQMRALGTEDLSAL